ncbi:WD40-repeat-containing domain protein [Cristinia sonorae]|uniref:WD40-repeat-containing domain protein n=1 Tax=Cristinia sonorae TaxID=1940300 RepID=A0A8K0UT97_9AGAR|nr:WD40-repeat-containing domain protein [Cristinia sonorae]
MDANSSYLCDTLPAARLASRSSSPAPLLAALPPPVTAFQPPELDDAKLIGDGGDVVVEGREVSEAKPARKLCVRHQRMADEGTNLKLQQALDALPVEERQAVNAVWSNFSSSPHPRRALILHGLLTMCCFSQLSLLSDQLSYLIRLDPFTVLPREISLKILKYLDAISLCRAAQVSKQWRGLADDDILWRGICEQHIGQKCLKCGWGLPILQKKRITRIPSPSPSPSPAPAAVLSPSLKREHDHDTVHAPEAKRARMDAGPSRPTPPSPPMEPSQSSTLAVPLALIGPERSETSTPNPLLAPNTPSIPNTVTRPWKDVYCERLTIERNWRRGRCTVRTLKGHTDGVMCLQFSETLTHPSFPILITGSYDRTARVWNLETGRELHCLTGHTRAVRALQFDEAKLITGSMDHTLKVWDWRTGTCLRTLEGHTEGVVCLNFDKNILASGSVDSTVKVWNFRTGECFALRGHRDWVNSVQLWDAGVAVRESFRTSSNSDAFLTQYASTTSQAGSSHIDPGKMLFSASDDGSIRLWDLADRTCVRSFTGHVGQVQSLKLLMVDKGCDEPDNSSTGPSTPTLQEAGAARQRGQNGQPASNPSLTPLDLASNPGFNPYAYLASSSGNPTPRVFAHPEPSEESSASSSKGKLSSSPPPSPPTSSSSHVPVLISGSLDNTIKLWDIESGKAVRTLFGHIEGVWAVASDNLRLVSGSHDRTIKVWNREEGRCTATLVGHRGAVTCLALGDDKIVSGSDDGDVRLWSFGGE